jgi:hypothetical protein
MRHPIDPSRWITILVLIGLALPVAARAQNIDSSADAQQIQTSCQRARQQLAEARPSGEHARSMVVMQECGDAGIETLVDYWRRPPSDSVLVSALGSVSARVNDRRPIKRRAP